MRFAAIGLGVGVWAAYGSGGLPLDHWLVVPTISVCVLYFSAQIFHVLVLNQNGVAYFSYSSVVRTPYKNISSLSLQGRNVANSKVVLWPSKSRHDISVVEDKVSTVVIELLRENRKRCIPLRYFARRNRMRIIQTLLERIKQSREAY